MSGLQKKMMRILLDHLDELNRHIHELDHDSNESAHKRKSGKTMKGNALLRDTLVVCAFGYPEGYVSK